MDVKECSVGKGMNIYDPDDDNKEDDEIKNGLKAMQNFLDQFENVEIFYIGCHLVNPVPCFAMAQVRKDLIAGFIGCVVYT